MRGYKSKKQKEKKYLPNPKCVLIWCLVHYTGCMCYYLTPGIVRLYSEQRAVWDCTTNRRKQQQQTEQSSG